MAFDTTALVQKSLQGDRDAFGDLVRRYEHAAFGLALSYVQDFPAAEDLTQEAFISAYRNLHRLRDPAKFGPWLKTTVTRLCLNWRRSRKANTFSIDEIGEDAMSLQHGSPSPDRLYESETLRARIMTAIGRLSEKNRQAVTLYYIDGLSVEEIGAFLETSPDSINQRLHRARTQLKEEMLTMVEDVLKTNHPKEFPEKVLREIAEQAAQAHKQYLHEESVRHYTQALEILNGLDETEEQQRWKADMLWERGNAAHFLEWKNNEKVIADLEAALSLEETLADRRKYAERLVRAGATYENARFPQKALDAYQKALTVYESIGDKCGQARCFYWIATKYTPWFSRKPHVVEPNYTTALQHLHRATELFRQAGEAAEEAMSLSAIALLEKIGEDPAAEYLKSIGTGGGSFERSPEAVRWGMGSGGGISKSEHEKDEWPVTGMTNYMCKPIELLFFPLKAGERRFYRTFAYGIEEMHATVTVERLDATVETPAGKFEQCLEMKTVFERRGEDPSESYRKLNIKNSGTRRIWFAPGIGIVRLTYQHGDGVETEARLTDCEIPDPTEDYFPLQVNARWHYRVQNTSFGYAVRDTWWITTQKENAFYYGHYHYAEKKNSA